MFEFRMISETKQLGEMQLFESISKDDMKRPFPSGKAWLFEVNGPEGAFQVQIIERALVYDVYTYKRSSYVCDFLAKAFDWNGVLA